MTFKGVKELANGNEDAEALVGEDDVAISALKKKPRIQISMLIDGDSEGKMLQNVSARERTTPS
jgi:hypothetical protein